MTENDRKTLETLRQELADECGVPVSEVTVITCGTTDCEHDNNGPWVEEDNFSSASCSKCGSLSIDRAMMELP